MPPVGLQPTTFRVKTDCSMQLSYGGVTDDARKCPPRSAVRRRWQLAHRTSHRATSASSSTSARSPPTASLIAKRFGPTWSNSRTAGSTSPQSTHDDRPRIPSTNAWFRSRSGRLGAASRRVAARRANARRRLVRRRWQLTQTTSHFPSSASSRADEAAVETRSETFAAFPEPTWSNSSTPTRGSPQSAQLRSARYASTSSRATLRRRSFAAATCALCRSPRARK